MQEYLFGLENLDNTLIKLGSPEKVAYFAHTLYGLDNYDILTNDEKRNLILSLVKIPQKVVIILKGPPGSGKTTLGHLLAKENKGIYLDQDMCAMQKGKPNANYKKSVDDAFLNGYTFVVLGKCHHTQAIRADITAIIPFDFKIIFVEFVYPQDDSAKFKELIISRIKSRKTHQTLNSSNPDVPSIIDKFFKEMIPISTSEGGAIIKLNVTHSAEQWISQITLPLIMPKLEPIIVPAKWRPSVYYSIDIEDIKEVLPLVKYGAEIKLQDKFHVTLRFFGKSTFMVEKPYYNILGTRVQVQCTGYACDAKGLAVSVQIDLPSANKHPHITLGNAEGIKPFYSNELLQNGIVKFDTPVILNGIVSKH